MFVRREVDQAVEQLAAEHAGAFTRTQVYDAGGSESLVRRRVEARRWLTMGGDVLTLAGSADTLDRRRWVGLFAAGPDAHLSHECAADLHRTNGVRRGLVVVTVNHPLHLVIDGVQLHQLDDVQVDHLTTVGPWPVTTPARTIMDLAAVLSWTRLKIAVQHVVVERQASFGQIDDVLRAVRRRGKPGVHKLVTVLDSLAGEPPPASALEERLHHVARLARLPIVRQFPLPWAREPVKGVVDAAVIDSKLILEADGRSWHARLEQMANDRRRDREAAEAGWQTLRWVYDDLVNDPHEAARSLLQIHCIRTGVSDRRKTSV